MAVSFKVPKSPQRSIFTIDEFAGVDLTNTGSNIDEVRSPNAENMVRNVPGKVRKRTGYHTKVKFGDPTDVNRALNTSDEWVEIPNVGSSWGNKTTLCRLNEVLPEPYAYMEFNGKGTYKVGRTYIDGGGTTWATITIDHQDEEEKSKVWCYPSSTPNTKESDELFIYKTSNDPDDHIKVKNIRVCSKTSATTVDEWKNLPWTPAPEDNGIVFVAENKTPAIYGCHPIKSGKFVGNRVKNVNRVLNSSDSFETYACDDTAWTKIADFGNLIYRTLEKWEITPMILEFDYISDNEVYVSDSSYSSDYILENTNGNVVHYKYRHLTGSFTDKGIDLKAVSGSATVQIKNLSLCYETDDDYVWSPAPEDRGQTFPIADVYNIASKNYAIRDSYSGSYNPQSDYGYIAQWIADADSHVCGFVRVSFDLYTTSEIPLDHIEVWVQEDSGSYILDSYQRLEENANHKHIEIFTSSSAADRYINAIFVGFFLAEAGNGRKITASMENVDIRAIYGKKSYDLSNKYYVYHAGSKFYLRASNSTKVSLLYETANEHLSQAWQLNEKLIIIDGKNIYSYQVGDETVEVLAEGSGYIPTVTISKKPSAGGTPYESLNMLQPGFIELFNVGTAEASETAFHLSFSGLDSTTVKAWILDDNGNWNEQEQGTKFTVDRAAGIVEFLTAPGSTMSQAMLSSGVDNVKILAYRTIPGYADRVAKCTVGTLFGVGGAADRLFISGNPDYPNWDFYSQQYDPTYFPDTGYSSLGSAASAIVGYAIINNYLATFKDDFDTSQAVFIREGDLVVDSNTGTSEPAFRLINTLQGNGVVAPYSFGYLQTEPLFLTRSGIYAITAQDITGEKYSQNRSFYLDGSLTKEHNLENAVATVFDDMYVLAVNNKFYILDGLQATRTDRSEPYATRQYVGFYCTNIPTVSIWTDDQALWIGTHDGKVCRFATDTEDLESYNDDGEPIYCCWETPDLSGKLFYKNKTFRYFTIRMMKALKTSVKMYAMKHGVWSDDPVKEDTLTGLTFDFDNIDFTRFTFSTDRSEKVVHTKIRIKKVDKARFKVENDALNEPFGLFDLALEYIESGNYKG